MSERHGDDEEEYTVEHGDTLSGIAQKLYGDGTEEAWRPIYMANQEVIGDDPDVIQPGMRLRIPKRA